MNIGYGVTVLANGVKQNRLDGIGHYTQALGDELVSDEGDSIVPICFGQAEGDLFGAPVASLGRYAKGAVVSALVGIPHAGYRDIKGQIDLFHATDHFIPKMPDIPVVATLMDVIPLSNPEWVNQRLRLAKNWLWRRASRWPDQIITISEYSKCNIVDYFGIAPEKISVTPLGVDRRFFMPVDPVTIADVTAKLELPERFYLFIGTLQPRKNIERIISAHESLPELFRREVPLIIVGRDGWGCDVLVRKLRSLGKEDNIRWLDYLSDTDKRVLLQSATAMVFPSLCEGFGLPVLEAFASKLPVITSLGTSLPEVVGDAAIMVNPLEVSEIADAMFEIADNDGLSLPLVQKGFERAQVFTWDRCAEKTRDVYELVLS